MEAIAERFSDAAITRLDGVSVDYDDWHFNVAPSNTEPLLRLCLESLVSERTWSAKRDERPRADPLVSLPAAAALAGRAPASTACRSRRRSPSAASTAT